MLREGDYDLRDQTLAACRRAGFEPYVALDGGEMDSMLRFVAAGIGLAILPEMVLADVDAHDGPVAVRRLLPRLSRALVLARRRDRYFSAAAREFTSVLEDAARLRSAALDHALWHLTRPQRRARGGPSAIAAARAAGSSQARQRTCAECGGPYRPMALLEGLVDRWFAPPPQHVSEFYPRHLKLDRADVDGRRARPRDVRGAGARKGQLQPVRDPGHADRRAAGWPKAGSKSTSPPRRPTDDTAYHVRFVDPDRWADELATAAFERSQNTQRGTLPFGSSGTGARSPAGRRRRRCGCAGRSGSGRAPTLTYQVPSSKRTWPSLRHARRGVARAHLVGDEAQHFAVGQRGRLRRIGRGGPRRQA